MGGGSSTQTDTMVVIWKRRPMTGTILLASTSRWTRPTSASSTAKASLFMRASRLDGAIDPGRARESAELSSDRIRDGRMAPILFHGLNQLDLPVCREPAGLSGAQVECGTLGASAGLRGLPPTKPSKSSLRPTQTNCRKNRRRFALIQHPSPSVQPSNRRGHETKERKASIAEKSAQPSTLLNLDHETAAIVKSMIASADRRYSIAQPTTLVGVEVLAKKRHFQSLGLPPWWT